MFGRYINWLLSQAERRRRRTTRLWLLAEDGILYLVVVPGLLIYFLALGLSRAAILVPRALELGLGGLGFLEGAFWLAWSAWTQFVRGGGTPHVAAPPRRLLVSGPYRLCRHPIQLGIMLYYLGLGTLAAGLGAGLGAFGAAFLGGSLYHRHVEEKELTSRFGESYARYRLRTPFLLPRRTETTREKQAPDRNNFDSPPAEV